MKVKWSPEAAVKSDNPSSILVLEPGERFTVHHNLAEVYDLSTLERNDKAQVTLAEAGAGFYIVNPESGEVAYTTATVVHEQPEIQVPSDVKFKTSHAAIQAPTPMAGCTPAETRAIQDTIPVTNRYISAARDYVPKNGGSGAGALYTKWFGKSSSANVQKVTTEFTNLMTNRFTGFTYNCHTAAPDCEEGDYAYVYARNYGIVYLCDEFFKAAVSGYDSKASTLVHEASHFIKNGGTVDVAYGVNASQNLAKMSPNRAVTNACNYEYFSVDADSATITSVEA
ncbi:hypothetical protein C8Q80DRAFT_629379 [Daedaleopsis nitida]|nr:hypothetical protein C8Q80DRAFT_629379 [Daedaleopsis nitida]